MNQESAHRLFLPSIKGSFLPLLPSRDPGAEGGDRRPRSPWLWTCLSCLSMSWAGDYSAVADLAAPRGVLLSSAVAAHGPWGPSNHQVPMPRGLLLPCPEHRSVPGLPLSTPRPPVTRATRSPASWLFRHLQTLADTLGAHGGLSPTPPGVSVRASHPLILLKPSWGQGALREETVTSRWPSCGQHPSFPLRIALLWPRSSRPLPVLWTLPRTHFLCLLCTMALTLLGLAWLLMR